MSIVGDLYVSQYPNVSLPVTVNKMDIYLKCLLNLQIYDWRGVSKYQGVNVSHGKPLHETQVIHPSIKVKNNTKIVQAKYRPVCVPEHICRLAVAFGGR